LPSFSDIYIFKDPDEIARMRDSGHLARRMLDFCLSLAAPGVTTDYIDALAHEEMVKNGAYPSPLLYSGFPKSICTSVNEVCCHGIPDSRPLQQGDMLKIDVSLYLNGFHGDNCGCVMVGEGDAKDKTGLMQTTSDALEAAIAICGPDV
jgi:methionyl aminopeptidase